MSRLRGSPGDGADAVTALAGTLEGIGIDKVRAQKYAENLYEAGYTTTLLRDITEEELSQAGVTLKPHVRAVLRLGTAAATPAGTPAVAAAEEKLQQRNPRKYFLFFSYAKKDTVGEVSALFDAARKAYPEAAIFRDAEEHFLLDDLIRQVTDADNVVVMLSEKYCKRPYTLIELVHAMRAGIHIVTVRVTRPGLGSFDFDGTAAALQSAQGVRALLDANGWKTLAQNHVSETDVKDALSRVLNVKAFDFGLDFPFAVREALTEQVFRGLVCLQPDSMVLLKRAAADGDHKTVIQVLKEKGGKNPSLAAEGCKVFSRLAWDRDEARRRSLGMDGAGEAVTAALAAFGATHPEIAVEGCGAIGCLAQNDANNVELGNLGACEAVIAALTAFGQTHQEVAYQGCVAVWQLAWNDANKVKLGKFGACKAVTAALSVLGQRRDDIAAKGCGAVWYLAWDNEANAAELGKLGACEAVIMALNAFGPMFLFVAYQGCGAVWALVAKNKSNSQTQANGCSPDDSSGPRQRAKDCGFHSTLLKYPKDGCV